jgi:hypothetical protein
LISKGSQRREEIKWLHTREIMTMINNTSPYCKSVEPKKLVPLSLDFQYEEDDLNSIALFQKMLK